MVKYYCIRCGYETIQKTNFKLHLNRKNICKSIMNDVDIIQVYAHNKIDVPDNLTCDSAKSRQIPPKIPPNPAKYEENNLHCRFCNRKFTRNDSVIKHEKLRCKNRNDLILSKKENNEIELLKKEMKEIKNENNKIKNKLKNRNKIINSMNNSNNTIINNFGDFTRKYDSITDEKIRELMKNPYKSLQKMLVLKHFNKKDPENQNIKINNLCGKYATVYQDGEWNAMIKKEAIETTLDDNYTDVSCYRDANQDDNYVNNKFNKLRNIYDNEENKVDKNELFDDTNRVIFNETQKLKRDENKNKA